MTDDNFSLSARGEGWGEVDLAARPERIPTLGFRMQQFQHLYPSKNQLHINHIQPAAKLEAHLLHVSYSLKPEVLVQTHAGWV